MGSFAARMMRNPLFSRVYEHAWRPVFTRGFSLGSPETPTTTPHYALPVPAR